MQYIIFQKIIRFFIHFRFKDYCSFWKTYILWLVKRRRKTGLWMSEIYCDHMVLQRDKQLKIRGHAKAGAHVTLFFAGYEKDTFAGVDGRWCIILPPIPKGGPYTMDIRSGRHRLNFKDVIMGEVWLVAGASFMQMHLWGANTGVDEMELWKKEEDNGKYLFPIRLFEKDWIPLGWRFSFSFSMLKWFDKYELLRLSSWRIVDANIVGSVAAYPYYFAKEVSTCLDVPIGIINVALAGCPTESYIEREFLEEQMPDLLKGPPNPYTFNSFADSVRKHNLLFSFNKYQKHYYDPGYAFESQIRSLDAYPITGVLFGGVFWHKDLAPRFISLFSMLVSCWRKNWGEDIPVYYLQPGRFHDVSLMSSGLPQMRNVTRMTSEVVSGTYMIVAYDMLDHTEKDVLHPKNRMIVGQRFAWSVLYHTYEHMEFAPLGLEYLQAVLEDNFIRIKFKWSEGLHTSDGKEPAEFEISSDNNLYIPVKAKIENDQIVLENCLNSSSVYIRYAWKDYPEVNVVNSRGWPLSTFLENVSDK